jgi:outer membrane protein OmpA-like peptidoglycan-associated protein
MKNQQLLRLSPLTVLATAALLTLGACSSVPQENLNLEQARQDLVSAQNSGAVQQYAPAEIKQANDALIKANDAWVAKETEARVNHLAYLTKQRVAIAQETSKQKVAEASVASAQGERDKTILAARTNEANTAQEQAELSNLRADESRRQANESMLQADAAKRQSDESLRQASASRVQTDNIKSRNDALEAQIREMNAKQTERGLIVTIEDVLFDTNQATLKTGNLRGVEKLIAFLQQYPKRSAIVEGFTDSVGSSASNQTLSDRRAEAVKSALVMQGISVNRVSSIGFGEAYPVASNSNSDGRQQNRRVEIVISDEQGIVKPR